MEGGLFGLSCLQKSYLYTSQMIPTFFVIIFRDLFLTLLFLQLFYLIAMSIYITFFSIEKSLYPYTSAELTKPRWQIRKGWQLSLSAFLLITIYGILIMRVGKVVLPHSISMGSLTYEYWWLCVLLLLLNPLLEELYWRLFLPKTFQESYEKSYLINISYLLFHFTLFSTYLGFWRAQPFVLTFYSVGRSMSHIKIKYGLLTAIITHYGITLAGLALLLYLKTWTHITLN